VGHSRHRKATHLARWLGPWADADATPSDVTRTTEVLDPSANGQAVKTYRYEPARAEVTGTYVVVQGLHYAGPDDARMDRFCRILASAGLLVIAPFVRDYLALNVRASAADEVAAACDHAVRVSAQRGLPRPAIFSISFGSTPAIEVAASERLRDAVGGLVLFGGFFEFNAVIRFAITGRAFEGAREVTLPHDPLNGPAVFVNLAPYLDIPGDRSAIVEAWRTITHRTWGRHDMRAPAKRRPMVEALAADLEPAQRELFRVGCGMAPGGAALLEVGLVGAGDFFDFTNVSAALGRVTAPVVISHGRDDDVIPFTEAAKLRDALRGDQRHRLHLTGLFDHTGSTAPSPGAVVGEVGTMLETLYSLVDAPHEAL
jgi:pimeloyl-ACP methyl ester carboxylesterase